MLKSFDRGGKGQQQILLGFPARKSTTTAKATLDLSTSFRMTGYRRQGF
jgi:hypothetical protein